MHMSFGRKIANRILLATTGPLAVMFLAGCLVAYLSGYNIYRYALSQLVVMLGVVILHGFWNRRLSVRLSRLVRTAERIDSGDLSARLPAESGVDEFSELGRALNKMADVLAARELALREQNNVLAALNSRMESVLNTTNDGIALLDREGRITLANRRFGELLGVRPEMLLNRTAQDAFPQVYGAEPPSPLIARIIELGRAATDRSVGVAEETIEVEGADAKFVQVYTAPVIAEDGVDWVGRIVALHDSTREYELDKMKSEFIDVVSHELRTPLTSILAYTDLMISGASGDTTDLQKEFLGIISTSTGRLSNLINDILDISRIESGRIKISFEPIDYLNIVKDVLRLMKAPADEKSIVMEASLPENMPPIRGDADKINQVLTNLVNNAVKYTPAGGWIKLMVEVTHDGNVCTCVADSGIGISGDDQKKLFQKFFRADNSSTREAGGTGLGLVITKTIVEMLGGAIWVESETGKGSRFYYTLPFYQEAGPVVAENVLLPDRGIGLVFVVDDNLAVRDAIQHYMHRRGFGTMTAGDAAETLQRARQHRPDAILLNMTMNEFGGIEVLRALKENRATASLPVVLTSIVSDPARGILSMGAFSLVQHPFENDRLSDALRGLIPITGNTNRASEENSSAGRKVLLIASGDRAAGELDGFKVAMGAHGVEVRMPSSLPEALAAAITDSPDIIAIDVDVAGGHDRSRMIELISALKVEEEAARIPIVLLTEEISDAHVLRHAGNVDPDVSGTLEYLYDQLMRVLTVSTEMAK